MPQTGWRSDLIESEQVQRFKGEKLLSPLNPIWACVAVGAANRVDDQFFILTQDDLQEVIIRNYRQELDRLGGKRPKNWQALDCWWSVDDIVSFKNKWHIIKNRLSAVPSVSA